jgi:transposase
MAESVGVGARASISQEQHLSYERIVETMRDLCGIELSEGGINAILRRGGEAAQPEAIKIGATVAQSEIIGSDETSARVCGRNWWQWVFRSAAGIVHIIAPTRGAQVIRQFMGGHCAECWVSDCYSSQLLAPTKYRQLCLAHQIRDLERVLEQDLQLRWPVERGVVSRSDPCVETVHPRRQTDLDW